MNEIDREILNHKAKAKFYKNNNIPVFIKTVKGWVHHGMIGELTEEYLIIKEYNEDKLVTFFEISIIDKIRNQFIQLKETERQQRPLPQKPLPLTEEEIRKKYEEEKLNLAEEEINAFNEFQKK